MKRCTDNQIAMTSCFGTTKLQGNMDTPRQVSAMDTPSSPTMSRTDPNTASIENKSESKDDPSPSTVSNVVASTTTESSDPQTLMGLKVKLDGRHWGKTFRGRQYIGRIVDYDIKDGYATFFVKFDDCTEKFDIDDLKKHKLITLQQHSLLQPSCLPRTNKRGRASST